MSFPYLNAKHTLAIAILLTLCTGADAASFNCARAQGCVENVICDSPQLSDMDSEMASLYYTLQSQSSRRGARALLSSQRQWLRSRNTCHCDANCLVGHYSDRIGQFRAVLYGN